MKKRWLFFIVSIFSFCLSSCGDSLSLVDDITNYFKEKAISSYISSSVSYSPFYRSVVSEEESFDSVYLKSQFGYTSIYSGVEIQGKELMKGSNAYLSYYYFKNYEDVWYDIFGHELEVGRYSIDYFVSYKAVARLNGWTYRNVFRIEKTPNMEDGVALIDVLRLPNGDCLYKLDTDTTYNFAYKTSGCVFKIIDDPISIVKESNYEYRVTTIDGNSYYYFINKGQQEDHVYVEEITDRHLPYFRLFDIKFPNLNYYYYVEQITDVTNSFDFFFSSDYAKAYGISFPAGYYKIHSSHPAGYLPFRIYLSKNHDYAFALCLKISSDKLLLPEFHAVKILKNGQLGGYTKEVELMVSNTNYVYFKSQYILLNYDDIRLVSPDNCYILSDSIGVHQIYVDGGTHIAGVVGSLASDVTPEKKIIFYNVTTTRTNIVLFDLTTSEKQTYDVQEMVDIDGLFYTYNRKLYFQYYVVGNYDGVSSLSLLRRLKHTILGQHFYTYVYQANNVFYNICCRGDIHK